MGGQLEASIWRRGEEEEDGRGGKEALPDDTRPAGKDDEEEGLEPRLEEMALADEDWRAAGDRKEREGGNGGGKGSPAAVGCIIIVSASTAVGAAHPAQLRASESAEEAPAVDVRLCCCFCASSLPRPSREDATSSSSSSSSTAFASFLPACGDAERPRLPLLLRGCRELSGVDTSSSSNRGGRDGGAEVLLVVLPAVSCAPRARR